MVIKKVLLCFLSLIASATFAQNVGDTIVVKALDYTSKTRDTIVSFPNGNLTYEKVIMRYAMRCKDGLVSPPISGQTNRGCGEWDYSCNTYLTDSTKSDSLPRTTDRYLIIPNTNTSGIYSSTPTWSGRPIAQKLVNLQNVVSEDTSKVGVGNLIDSTTFKVSGNGGKVYILMTQTELSAAGLVAGDIDGFSFFNLGTGVALKNFKVSVKSTTLNSLAAPTTAFFNGFQETFYHNYNCVNGENRVQFYTPFIWDGSSNVVFELSYVGKPNNSKLNIQSHLAVNTNVLAAMEDYSYNFFPSNYIEADSYYGIPSNNQRTVEAWIKTTVKGKEIASWGTNSAGQKFSFRTENSGFLRLEINSGFAVGSTNVADGNWHHVALVFSGNTTSQIQFYVDGVLEVNSSVNNLAINTGNSLAVQVSNGFHGRYFEGEIDDLRIWSTALSPTTIADWSYRKVDASHPNYSSFELNYAAKEQTSIVEDESANGRNGVFNFSSSYKELVGEQHFKEFVAAAYRPNINLFQGTYNQSIIQDTVIDTTFQKPYAVIERSIYPKPGTIYSDSIASVTTNYWPQNNIMYDFNGVVISTTPSASSVTLQNSVLNYFDRSASQLEIMSFVTPYGINLDLGMAGKAWYFDVTDFTPILKGNKRLQMTRGGQFQEQMDIQFLFIVGTPPRDVVDIQQIWKVDMRSYAVISTDEYYEPRTVQLPTAASQFKLRSAITGHGQEGEFIPRNHYLRLNNGATTFNWQVWKECSENPVYPQGGTWIYDRAGWCPGMATDVKEYDITANVASSTSFDIDYGVTIATGTSNYIVNNQLVSYGAANFNLDARVTEIMSPTDRVEYARENPMCNNPEIEIQNSGSTALTSATITYWINNSTTPLTYNWTGNLAFLQKATVSLPVTPTFWAGAQQTNTFHAVISSVNGAADQYAYNDTMRSTFILPQIFPNQFYVQFYTNNAASESSYDIRDAAGVVLFQRNGMSNSTVYKDTLTLNQGCYSFNVYDSDDDGISFFANSDGNGSIQLRNTSGGVIRSIAGDYGGGIKYQFNIATPVGVEETDIKSSIIVYPNPSHSIVNIETTGKDIEELLIYDVKGQFVKQIQVSQGIHHQIHQVDVTSLEEGLYFVRLRSNGVMETKRFIVTH